jgi:hypothetical protein
VNIYRHLAHRLDAPDARDLADRLSEWHDEMVAHERRRRAAASRNLCDDECPHATARELWRSAVAVFGDLARDLTFLARYGAASRTRLRAARS